MRLFAVALLALSAGCATPETIVTLPPALLQKIEKGDCDGAVKLLNELLRQPTAGTLIVGGAMYERGACLIANAEKARDFYAKAYGIGDRRLAPVYLTALAASSVGGSDTTATLWWAREIKYRQPLAMLTECKVQNDSTPEGFAQELTTWSDERRELCRMLTGLVAMAEAIAPLYPSVALRQGEQGRLLVRVDLSDGSVRVIPSSPADTPELRKLVISLYTDALQRLGKPRVQLTRSVVEIPWDFKIR